MTPGISFTFYCHFNQEQETPDFLTLHSRSSLTPHFLLSYFPFLQSQPPFHSFIIILHPTFFSALSLSTEPHFFLPFSLLFFSPFLYPLNHLHFLPFPYLSFFSFSIFWRSSPLFFSYILHFFFSPSILSSFPYFFLLFFCLPISCTFHTTFFSPRFFFPQSYLPSLVFFTLHTTFLACKHCYLRSSLIPLPCPDIITHVVLVVPLPATFYTPADNYFMSRREDRGVCEGHANEGYNNAMCF